MNQSNKCKTGLSDGAAWFGLMFSMLKQILSYSQIVSVFLSKWNRAHLTNESHLAFVWKCWLSSVYLHSKLSVPFFSFFSEGEITQKRNGDREWR